MISNKISKFKIISLIFTSSTNVQISAQYKYCNFKTRLQTTLRGCLLFGHILVSSNCHLQKRQSKTYLCVLSNLFSKCQSHRKQSHICCIFTFLHCAFSSVSLNCLPEKSHSHIGCICLTLLHCALTNVSSSPQLARKDAKSHWLHFFDFSPLCVFKCVLKALE